MARTREYIEILRKILKREAALQHQGELYQIPYTGPGADRARQAIEEHPARQP